jgi:pilus assembly protein CpaB
MADRRYTTVFMMAVIVALGATYGVYRYLQHATENAREPSQPVVVAAQDMTEGARLDRASLSVTMWPATTVPPGAFSVPDSVVGRVARVPVFKGEAIVPGRLAPAGTGPGLEVKITPGKRAMAVKINDVVGLAGLIQPNSRVDVLVTLKEEGSQDKQRAKLFMNDVRVLSVGTQVERSEDGKAISATTAALEVSPTEAERLAVAMNQGSIQLVLRGYGDPDSVKTTGATSNDVLGQMRVPLTTVAEATPPVRRRAPAPAPAPRPSAPPPPPPPVTPPHRADSAVVEVYRGSKLQQQKFDNADSARDSASKKGAQ